MRPDLVVSCLVELKIQKKMTHLELEGNTNQKHDKCMHAGGQSFVLLLLLLEFLPLLECTPIDV